MGSSRSIFGNWLLEEHLLELPAPGPCFFEGILEISRGISRFPSSAEVRNVGFLEKSDILVQQMAEHLGFALPPEKLQKRVNSGVFWEPERGFLEKSLFPYRLARGSVTSGFPRNPEFSPEFRRFLEKSPIDPARSRAFRGISREIPLFRAFPRDSPLFYGTFREPAFPSLGARKWCNSMGISLTAGQDRNWLELSRILGNSRQFVGTPRQLRYLADPVYKEWAPRGAHIRK